MPKCSFSCLWVLTLLQNQCIFHSVTVILSWNCMYHLHLFHCNANYRIILSIPSPSFNLLCMILITSGTKVTCLKRDPHCFLAAWCTIDHSLLHIIIVELWYIDIVRNTIEVTSSIFFLIPGQQLPWARAYGQSNCTNEVLCFLTVDAG